MDQQTFEAFLSHTYNYLVDAPEHVKIFQIQLLVFKAVLAWTKNHYFQDMYLFFIWNTLRT